MRIGLLLLCCGCRQLLGFEEVAGVDGQQVTQDAASPICVGAANGLLPQTCFDPVPPALLISDLVIDTDGVCSITDRNDLCILAGQQIDIAGTVVARGSRPLVLWSASTITISENAILDLHSAGILIIGAGANDASCSDGDGGFLSTDPQIGAGGCGGSFGSAGGNSGVARLANGSSSSTECSSLAVPLDRVRGGCRGGHGGISDTVGSLNGGNSGGAVYLMAADSIRVAGVIDARGGGGRVANANSARLPGGGGGGSGGLIGFDAASLNLDNATLIAVGGGGSSGSGESGMIPIQGNPGNTGTLVSPFVAPSCNGTVPTNFGAASEATGGSVAANGTANGGGGGGGGGNGIIIAFTTDRPSLDNATIVPMLR